ncbi:MULTISPECIES: AAA family ATPase [Microbacterium]|uniref:AAA family ATPase n=1 Tax=Microbacterium TaxID=33882 RepID=UPI00277E0D93|nr:MULTISPECIES: AAA family ATPase [Microbacterium]MDQ1075718.1 putative ABC-type ATPase [Microbacterium sp. SORGH_AS_0969]MDQ1115961.1 putative ABC-type ATPase [Microbacterium testaceum]
MPHLHLLVGPNGSGKSTYVHDVLYPSQPANVSLPFVNADNIARRRWPDAQMENARRAARIAEQQRNEMIARGQSFIAETVFSHSSKLDLLRRAASHGFTTHVHVMMVPVDLAVQRVGDRVLAGEHDVPEEKVRARFERLWPHVVEAAALADAMDLFDNSQPAAPFRLCARIRHGALIGSAEWPKWAPAEIRAFSDEGAR